MAINTTRGLPSFSEMYNAFKNRGSLADVINAGVKGYTEGSAAVSKAKKEAAEAREADAHADYYKFQSQGGGQKFVELGGMDDAARTALGPYAKDGKVDETTYKMYLATTKQGQDANKAQEQLEQKQRELAQQAKHQEEMAALKEQIATMQNQLGQSNQELNAAQTVANVTSKEADPTLFERGVSFVKESVGGDPLGSVLAERQKKAALKKLSERGGMAPASTPNVTPSAEQLMTQPAPQPQRVPRPMGKSNKPVAVYTQEDYDKLPMGQSYIDSTGKVKVKGK